MQKTGGVYVTEFGMLTKKYIYDSKSPKSQRYTLFQNQK
uniref:Uncharacterized protein n=1 Tax=viral metagenome TaxID=1070528 RepID=A0A6C0ECI9_9ZZZZ